VNDLAASFYDHGLVGNVSIAPGHAIQIALYPEEDDHNIICCQTKVRHKDAANRFRDVESEEIAIAVCDKVEKLASSILQRYGFDVTAVSFIDDVNQTSYVGR